MNRRCFVLVFFLAFSVATAFGQTVSSPDGEVVLTVALSTDGSESSPGVLHYEISYRGRPLIVASAMGFDLGDALLGDALSEVSRTPDSGEEVYSLLHGKTSQVQDAWNGSRVEFVSPAHGRLVVEARVFDDAVAFRYLLPEDSQRRTISVREELTAFRFARDATAFVMPLPSFESMYESEYLELPLSALANQGGSNGRLLLGLPALVEVPGHAWVGLVEADLQGTTALYLRGSSGGWTSHELVAALAPRLEEPSAAILSERPFTSAWRVVLIGDQPGDLIESTVVTSLNPPRAIDDVSFVRAGKAAWNWWSGSVGRDGLKDFTTEGLEHYVDFAAEMGLEYLLVDAGWSAFDDLTRKRDGSDVDIERVIRYARERGVGVWLWAHYKAVARQMEEAFSLFERWGVAGVKIDFVSRDDQEGIDFYYRTAASAARHRLMVDFHGSTKPSGMERTWPNVLGFEAVLGMEQSKAGARDDPDHRLMLPFTRMLVGQMDYTPGGFRNVTRLDFEARMQEPVVMGTRAHHLAMYVVFDAPFQMVSDHPAAYRGETGIGFLKQVPSRWDETRVLAARPGEFVVIARRSGSDWYLGAMSGWAGRELELPLSFLGNGSYVASVFADEPRSAEQPTVVRASSTRAVASDRWTIDMVPGGGFAAHFKAP